MHSLENVHQRYYMQVGNNFFPFAGSMQNRERREFTRVHSFRKWQQHMEQHAHRQVERGKQLL